MAAQRVEFVLFLPASDKMMKEGEMDRRHRDQGGYDERGATRSGIRSRFVWTQCGRVRTV